MRIRREKDWSQEKLAFESGIHRTYISGMERGIRNPTRLKRKRGDIEPASSHRHDGEGDNVAESS